MVTTNILQRYFIMCVFVLTQTFSYSQVLISQLPPNPVRFSVDDLWDITIINNDEGRQVFLKGSLSSEQGNRIFESYTSEFSIVKGTKRVNKNDIQTLNTSYNTNNPSAQIISQFNNLPYGKYTLCVNVYDVDNNDLLAESCIDYESQPVTPPTLLTPDFCQEVNTKFPFFSWLSPMPEIRGQQVYYDFKLTEVINGQSYEDAIQRNLAVVFASNLTQTNFLYPSTATPLDSTKIYVWQVQAKVKKNNSYEMPDEINSFQNVGISEVWCLKYKKPDVPEIIVKKEDVTYAQPKLYEDAEISATNILYLSYNEKFVAGNINYKVLNKEGREVDVNIVLQAKKGDNRYDINLKQTGLFKNKQLYKLVIKNSNNETYYLNFRYIEK